MIEITDSTVAGKPVVFHHVKHVINMDSGFGHKLLCDRVTFSLGTACAFRCKYCFVESFMRKSEDVQEAMETTRRSFQDIVIRRKDGLKKMRDQLTDAKGRPKFKSDDDKRVIYGSPLVDVAGNLELAKETVEACKIILDFTNWQIRLLSKSNLLPLIAENLPTEHKARVIYGVSTGTLDNNLAKSFEEGTALVSKRIKAIHELQDAGFRTFGMICPSLPQKDYVTFSKEIVAALRIDRMENCWAEVLNVRGDSMTQTCEALAAGGYSAEARALAHVSTDKDAWEQYSRDTFLAHTAHVPPAKLRFLQYVSASNIEWWRKHESKGAVLLGSILEKKNS